MINKDCDELMPQIKQESISSSSSDEIRQYLTKSWCQVMEDELNGKCDVKADFLLFILCNA